MNTYYDELGIKPDATDEEIRIAFRRKAKKAHPDKGGKSEDMSQINRAYETLISPERRLTYDRTGETQVPDVDAIAKNMVLQRVMAVVANVNCSNPIMEVIHGIYAEMGENEKQIANGQAHLKRIKGRIKRLKRKAKRGPDFIRQAIEYEAIKTSQQIEQIKDARKRLERAIELLSDYEYETETGVQFGPVAVTFGA